MIAHGRWVYNRLDVHNRTELVNRLLSVAAGRAVTISNSSGEISFGAVRVSDGRSAINERKPCMRESLRMVDAIKAAEETRRVALVTGGSRGLGAVMARELAAAGWS